MHGSRTFAASAWLAGVTRSGVTVISWPNWRTTCATRRLPMNEFETTQQSRYQALLAAHETTAAVLVGIPGKPCALEESGPTCPWPTFVEDVILELARRAANIAN